MQMEVSVQVAVISAAASIVAVAVTSILNKRQQLAATLREQKLNHYKVLLSALSDLAVDGTDKDKANQHFALAVNTIALVAPQSVIDALMKFHDEAKFSNPNPSGDRHDELLKKLLLAIRADLKLPFKDDPRTFDFHLIGSSPSRKNR